MTIPNATPSSATPTSTAAPSTGTANTGTSNSGAMSTADFRRSILGKPSPKPAPVVSPEPVSSSDDNVDLSSSDDNDSFAQESVEEQVQNADSSVDEQPDAEDWAWAESYKPYRDGVHGVAAAELLQALSQGQLPDALMDKLSLTMRDGDEEWTGTVADLRNGAQMQKKFTKNSQALAKEKAEFYAERGELVEYFRGWKADAESDSETAGEKGLLGLEKMLGEKGVYKIAEQLARRLQRKEQLEAAEAAGHIPAGTAAIVLERERLARENAELARYKARAEQQTQAKEVSDRGTETGKRINQEAITQFKLAGIQGADLTEGVWNLFKEELLALWTDASKDPTTAEIRTAVMAAKQRSDSYVRAYEAKQKAQAAKKPAVTGAAPAGAPGAPKKPAAGSGSGNKAMSVAEFRKTRMGGRP